MKDHPLVRVIRAYPTLLRVGLAEAVAYRAEMVVWMLTMTMPLVSLALWSAVAESAPVGRFTQRGFAAYFLAMLVVRQLTGSWIVWEMNQEIRSGALARRLLKPIHPLVAYSAENLAALPLRAAFAVPFAALTIWAIRPEALPRTPSALAIWAASMLGAWLLNFMTMAAIGSLAFFLESSTAIFDVYLVPLELFPSSLRSAAHALPFRYTLAFPVEALTGALAPDRALRELASQWAYVAAMTTLALLTFRAGARRFAAYGG
jgi:ABC-2 type transport system permease protein